MSLGQRISQHRKNLGISQETLGERLGVSRQAVSKWETGTATPDIENLLALARVFGVSVAELTETPEESSGSDPAPDPSASARQPSFRRTFWSVICAIPALLLSGVLVLTFLMNRPFADPAEKPVEHPPSAPQTSPEQSIPSPTPETDFALLWYGRDGHEEFLELGVQEGFFPFGTTLELTEPLESHDTDFSVMTTHTADCGAVTVNYHHIEEDLELDPESPERESIWCLSTIVSDVRTPRDIHPGSTKAQVLDAYGDDLVYCMKETGSYTLAKHDYYYAFQTPETFGASLQLFMSDGIVAGIRVEHRMDEGNLAFAPDNLSRFPMKDGEPDFSLREEPEREAISNTRKVYIAWNQLITNNNLSAEERYTYRQTVFSLLPLMDWEELRTLGITDANPDAAIFGLIAWLSQQETYSPSEILCLQTGKFAAGLDGAYAEGYNHALTQALLYDPLTFAKSLAHHTLDDNRRGALIIGVAYDSPWYEPQHSHTAETLESAFSDGAFAEAELGWARLLHLYLTVEMVDGSFDESLPRTPAELEYWSASHPDWWDRAWEEKATEQ